MSKERDAAIEAVRGWLDWAKRCGQPPESVCKNIVDAVAHAYAEALIPDKNGWFDIASLPEGQHVTLYWQEGERGGGGVECGMIFRGRSEEDRWSYWTHGGPNSGLDYDPRDDERPSHWRPNPPSPKSASVIDGSLAPPLLPTATDSSP